MRHTRGLERTQFGAATRELWFEFKVAADYSAGMSEPTRGAMQPPAGFVRYELGMGLDSPDPCGPGCTCNALRVRSTPSPDGQRRRQAMRDESQQRPGRGVSGDGKKRSVRHTGGDYKRQIQALVARARAA